MDNNILDTKLHTRFAIFLYALQLETTLLTRYVFLDAADAERLDVSLTELCEPRRNATRYTNSTSAH